MSIRNFTSSIYGNIILTRYNLSILGPNFTIELYSLSKHICPCRFRGIKTFFTNCNNTLLNIIASNTTVINHWITRCECSTTCINKCAIINRNTIWVGNDNMCLIPCYFKSTIHGCRARTSYFIQNSIGCRAH